MRLFHTALIVLLAQLAPPATQAADCPVALPTTIEGLPMVAQGVRAKRILIPVIKLYQVAFYKAPAGEFPRAMVISPLADIGQSQIKSSFQKALELNKINVAETGLSELLEIIPALKKGENIQFMAPQNNELKIAGKGIDKSFQGPGIASAFWSIWHGIGADSKMTELIDHLKQAKGAACQ